MGYSSPSHRNTYCTDMHESQTRDSGNIAILSPPAQAVHLVVTHMGDFQAIKEYKLQDATTESLVWPLCRCKPARSWWRKP